MVPRVVADEGMEALMQQYHLAQVMIGSPACQKIIADNVAQYYADTPKQDWSLNGKNFPCVAPPFQGAWFIEWTETNYFIGPNGREDTPTDQKIQQGGSLLVNVPLNTAGQIFKEHGIGGDELESLLASSKWFLMIQHLCTKDGQVIFLPFSHGVFVGKTGEFIRAIFLSRLINPDLIDASILTGESFTRLHVPLLTTGFLHCKNVDRIDATKMEGPPPGWCKRKRLPSLEYHTITINPNISSKPRSDERKTEGDRSGKALHICRGHFMHCVNDGVSNGLFGKGIYGTFWVPSHVRGTADLGQVIPTYNVLAPTG